MIEVWLPDKIKIMNLGLENVTGKKGLMQKQQKL